MQPRTLLTTLSLKIVSEPMKFKGQTSLGSSLVKVFCGLWSSNLCTDYTDSQSWQAKSSIQFMHNVLYQQWCVVVLLDCAVDFTLAEILTLGAVQRWPFRDQSYNGWISSPQPPCFPGFWWVHCNTICTLQPPFCLKFEHHILLT
jgi:hypothetical protein